MLTVCCRRHAAQWASRTCRVYLSTAVADEGSPSSSNAPSSPPQPAPLPECSQPLGAPMPVDEHACSVSLPTWSSVVGYEEGNPAVVNAMQCGYPRFVYHPYVLQCMQHVLQQYSQNNNSNASSSKKEDCLLLPSIHAARRCQIFLLRALYGDEADERFGLSDPALVGTQSAADVADAAALTSDQSPVRVLSLPGNSSSSSTAAAVALHAVLFPATTVAGTQAKAYWQHTGEVVSSRRAQACLQEWQVPLTKTVTEHQIVCHQHDSSMTVDGEADASDTHVWMPLRKSLASWAGTRPEDVVLTPSGMAAVYAALQSARRRHMQRHPNRKGGRAIVYGFPYLDTLKLCSRSELCPDGVEFFGRADDRDLTTLEAYLERNPDEVSVVLTEVPSNPLLHCPNVHKLRELADRFNFMLVVDDTIATYLNVDLLSSGLADATVSSLTKLVSGRGDAMVGSVVCSPRTDGGQWMQQDLCNLAEGPASGVYCPDAVALLRNSHDFPERSARINETTEALADWLVDHEGVKAVYYPKLSHSANLYHDVQHQNPFDNGTAGYGGLFSMVLDPHMCERTLRRPGCSQGTLVGDKLYSCLSLHAVGPLS